MTDHPGIKRQALYDGWSENADVDLNDFATVQQLKLVALPPDQRVRALEEIDAAMSADDVSVRRKSELLQVRRRMAFTHEAMLRAKR